MIMDNILSIIRKGKDFTKDINELNDSRPQSIARKAKATTCQFPCLVSNNVNFQMAVAVAKNMDRVYASFVQTVIGSNPMVDITIDRTPLEYMRKLHQNLRLESVINEKELLSDDEAKINIKTFMESVCPNLEVPDYLYDDFMEKAYKGEYKLFMDPSGTYGIAFSEGVMNSECYQENKRQLQEHLSMFDLKPFPVKEADSPIRKSDIVGGIADAAYRKSYSDASKTTAEIYKNMTGGGTKILDMDVKRANEMQPYVIQVRLMAVNDKKEFVQYMDFLVGIKTILHVVKSTDVVNNIANVLRNRNAIFNFVKWTTGEISFFRDLLFHIDQLKDDTTYRSRNASPFFPTLRRMKDKRFEASFAGIRKLIPNSTLVISQFDVDDVKRTYGFDIRDSYFAKKVIKELFLLAFVIVDEGSETLDIMYESDDSFETYTLETLEKEISLSSNKLGKEIGRMISQ